MKKLLPFLALAVLIAIAVTSCNTNPAMNTTQSVQVQDTAGLAAYKLWKAQNELVNTTAPQQQAPVTKVQTIVKRVPVRTSSPSYAMSSQSSSAAKAKKGWSKSAKGAVIGGVGGAAIGAIINKKNRVLGGIIGGVLGAAGGYGIGRGMDRKDGRIE